MLPPFGPKPSSAERRSTSEIEARALHLSHARARWKDDLDASERYLDFLPRSVASALVGYLKGDLTMHSLEAVAAAAFRESDGLPQVGVAS